MSDESISYEGRPRAARDQLPMPPQLVSIDPERIPGPNENAHATDVFIAELVTLNTMLARYVLRHADADAGRTGPTPAVDVLTLAERLAAAAASLCEHMRRREHDSGDPKQSVED